MPTPTPILLTRYELNQVLAAIDVAYDGLNDASKRGARVDRKRQALIRAYGKLYDAPVAAR